MAEQITSLSNPLSLDAGTGLQFTIATTGGESELVIPAVDIGDVLSFFAHCARAVGDEIDQRDGITNDLVPIHATGIGFQAGATPDTTLLVINLSGFGLAFEVGSSALADMAQQLSHIALTLSASGKRPN